MSVIVPTYNEAGNLPTLLDRLQAVLAGVAYEIVVVDDDSPDNTWRIATDRSRKDATIRVIRRMGRRGLSSAVLEGMDAASGSIMAVLDADLQHDEAILPKLVEAVRSGRADVAIGSREAPGGSYGEFGPVRRALSFVGSKVASAALGVGVSDPMSGYFALSAERYHDVRPAVNPRGFKILLDLLATGQRPDVVEIGYGFRSRRSGETKLSGGVVGAFGLSIAELTLRRLKTRVSGHDSATQPNADQSTFVTYLGVVVTATGTRLAVASLLAAAGLGPKLALAAIELGVLAEFAGHHHFTFPTSHGTRRPMVELRKLGIFHAVAANTLLAHAGIGAGVTKLLSSPATGMRLVPAYGLVVSGVTITVVIGYHLSRTLVWSDTPAEGLTPSPDAPVGDQDSRPMTPSTSEEISSTALR
ncbi:MAG: glycosyltransferase [Acidimicrobiales bacterium]